MHSNYYSAINVIRLPPQYNTVAAADRHIAYSKHIMIIYLIYQGAASQGRPAVPAQSCIVPVLQANLIPNLRTNPLTY